jgi:hypothetical protein
MQTLRQREGAVPIGMPNKRRRKHRVATKVQPSGYCAAQRKYAFTEERARVLLKTLKGHPGKKGMEDRAYRCPWGDHWHVTSKPPLGADT